MNRTTRWALLAVLLTHFAVAPARAQEVVFTPENGFSGISEGTGTLKLLFGKRRPFHVHSDGQKESDASFAISQTVTFNGQEPTSRLWRIRESAPLRYTGTLSDAAGAVTGHTSGRRLSLRYRIKGPLVMHQTLVLMPDGRTIDNRGRITFLGVPVGSLRETIRRLPPS